MSDDRDTPQVQVFRPSRRYFYDGIGSMLVFLIIIVWSWLWLLRGDPEEQGFTGPGGQLVAVAMFTLVFGSGSCLGACQALQAHFERITLSTDRIRVDSVFRSWEMQFEAIEKISWSKQDGTLGLFGQQARETIDLHHFDDQARLTMIRFFRSAFQEVEQTGWPEYCWGGALPTKRRVTWAEEPEGSPGEGLAVISRSKIDRLFAILLLPVLLFCIAGASGTGDIGILYVLPIVVSIWLAIRFLTPKKGYITRNLEWDRGGKWLLFGVILFLSSPSFSLICLAFGLEEQAAFWTVAALALGSLCVIAKAIHLIGKHKSELIAKAPAEWERLESELDNPTQPVSTRESN